MTQSFSDLKKNSSSQFEKINQALEKLNKPAYEEDKSYWRAAVDKAGNGSAIIRFLPAPPNEDEPFVRYWSHGFKGPSGMWYMENSLTTLGQADPLSEYNTELWNTGTEANKKIASAQKRNLNFVSNIYVVKDPVNPDNEGKTFKFRYGKKIFDMLNAAMHPEQDELDVDPKKPINPFDFWEGANFKLIIRKVDGFTNYDKSSFMDPSPLLKDDKALEALWKSLPSLKAVVAPDQFKSYDELKRRLYVVLGLDKTAGSQLPREEKPEEPKRERSKSEPAQDFSGSAEDIDLFQRLAES